MTSQSRWKTAGCASSTTATSQRFCVNTPTSASGCCGHSPTGCPPWSGSWPPSPPAMSLPASLPTYCSLPHAAGQVQEVGSDAGSDIAGGDGGQEPLHGGQPVGECPQHPLADVGVFTQKRCEVAVVEDAH